jgi:hypothetical protein
VIDREGTFEGDASVSLDLDCGSVAITTQSDRDGKPTAAYRGPEPVVTATGTSLTLGSPDHRRAPPPGLDHRARDGRAA